MKAKRIPAEHQPPRKAQEHLTSTVLPIDKLFVPPDAARLADRQIDELAKSIDAQGQLQPILVTRTNVEVEDMYRVVDGRRRVDAFKALGIATINAVVMDFEDDEKEDQARDVANLQHLSLTAAEAAIVVGDLVFQRTAAILLDRHPELDAGVMTTLPIKEQQEIYGRAVEAVADAIGKSVRWVRDHGFIAGMCEEARSALLEGRLPFTHAREIAKVEDHSAQAEIVKQIAAQGTKSPKDLDFCRLLVSRRLLSLGGVAWRLDVPFAGAVACEACPHNSANNPGLFEDSTAYAADMRDANRSGTYERVKDRGKEPAAGVCLKISCFRHKAATANRTLATSASKVARLTKEGTPLAAAVNEAASAAPYLQPAQIRRKAETKKRTPAKPAGKGGREVDVRQATPKELAKVKYDNAMREWEIAARKVFDKALKPHERAILEALDDAQPTWVALGNTWRGKNAEQALRSPAASRIKTILRQDTLPKADLEFIGSGKTMPWLDGYQFDIVIEALGAARFNLKPKPVIEDFIPKQAEKPAKTSKTRTPAKKATRKRGKA